jgi:glutathione S-transferase
MSEPLTLYSHRELPNDGAIVYLKSNKAYSGQGPNPWKTVNLLEELGLKYETIFLEFGASEHGVQGEDFMKKNPAGRVPLIYDATTGSWTPCYLLRELILMHLIQLRIGISIAESNNIAQYLVAQYDKKGTLTTDTTPDKYLVQQWLFFQAASQGPFFAQVSHPPLNQRSVFKIRSR